MSPEILALPAAGLGIIAILGLLGGAEAAVTQVGLHRVQRLLAGENGDDRFKPDEQASILTTLLMVRIVLILLLGGLVTSWAVSIQPTAGYLAGSLFIAALVLVWVEIFCRRTARARSEEVAGKALPALIRVEALLRPLVNVLFAFTSPFTPAGDQLPLASLEDIHQEIRELKTQGLLEEAQSEIIQSIFEFGETIAREVMVPRVDMVCTELSTPVGDVLKLMSQHGYSRIPVYEGNIDNILGMVHVKDLVVKRLDRKDAIITREDLRETKMVPGTKKIMEILREFQRDKTAMAVVLDEYGGTDGLLTIEDIVEEIVGEINDEYDQEVADLEWLPDGAAVVDAKMILEDVNESLGVELPVDEHETLGGFVYGLLGKVPQAGEMIELDGLRLTVENVQRRRITQVKIERVEKNVEEHVA